MNLLAIDTATETLALAVAVGARVHERAIVAGQRQAELALGEIDSLLGEAGIAVGDLHGVVFGAGPGSFTGLRIACGIAQGIAAARGIPVIGMSTLAAMAAAADHDRVVVCLDARMGEVYHAAYERRADALHEVFPPALHRPDAVPVPAGTGWVGCGGGFPAHRGALVARHGGSLAAILPDVVPSAGAMLRLATPHFAAGAGGDAAAAVPVYLRERVALKSHER
jgi:tRNA threonylcarbamoyladenosine biosynthesis protein TsaB